MYHEVLYIKSEPIELDRGNHCGETDSFGWAEQWPSTLSFATCCVGTVGGQRHRLGITGGNEQLLPVSGGANGLHPGPADRLRHDVDGGPSLSLSGEPVPRHRRIVQLCEVHLRVRPCLSGGLVYVPGLYRHLLGQRYEHPAVHEVFSKGRFAARLPLYGLWL